MFGSLDQKLIDRKDEYNSLKAEYMACQEKQHSNNLGILSLVVAILSFSMVLFEDTRDIHLAGDDYYAVATNIYLILLRIIAYALPLIIISTLSMKAERNYKQMIITSIYLQVMYEYPSWKNADKACIWESNCQKLMSERGDIIFFERIYSFFNKKFIHSELFIFSWFVNMFQGTLLIVELYDIWQTATGLTFAYCAAIMFIPAVILCLFGCTVWHNTSVKQLKRRYEDFFKKKIIDIAVENEIIKDSDRDDCWEYISIA